MSGNEGDVAPGISGTDLVSDTPWSLDAQAPADVMLAFTAITGAGPFDYEALALAAVWNELNGKTDAPFSMAIIAGIKGPGAPPPKETVPELKAAIQKFQITCPVILSPQSWITYLFPDKTVPALFCLHWDDQIGKYKIGKIYEAGISNDVDQMTKNILGFLDACGVHKKSTTEDPGRVPNVGAFLALPVLMQVFGGPASDGGGWGVTFGGRPIPVPPWDPLRPLGSAGRDAAVGLVVASLANQIKNPDLRNQIWQAGVNAAKSSVDRIGAIGSGGMVAGFKIEGHL